ncbi:uncharacterized protein N7469_002238 [Penicillium citrinum]|uniref:Uncharacterized protein n=1 Tax=Penicillium citrinum TaxID=5077 RepID=A0A9W9PA65_PENCI|nr:uncharacterized protein N7469_002238 [Penicillium citrinum]KAJ5240647.1 hypothetical protein N7469_002238 [Penicillium citrinum]
MTNNESTDVDMNTGNSESGKKDEGTDEDGDGYDDEADENNEHSDSEDSSMFGRQSLAKVENDLHDLVIRDAQAFLNTCEEGKDGTVRTQALCVMNELRALAVEIKDSYAIQGDDGLALFKRLLTYFDGDSLESITSSELIIEVLLEVLGD